MLRRMKPTTETQTKPAEIRVAARSVAERLASPDAKAELERVARASRARSEEIVTSARVDPRSLAKRVTF